MTDLAHCKLDLMLIVLCRTRQGKLIEALADLNESIRIAPWSVDPVLNRYVARAEQPVIVSFSECE